MAVLLICTEAEDGISSGTIQTPIAGFGLTSVPRFDTLATFRSANVRGSFHCVQTSFEFNTRTFASSGECWTHFNTYAGAVSNATNAVIVWKSALNANASQVRMVKTAATTFQMQISPNGGGSWTAIGGTFTLANTTRHVIDVRIKFHATTGAIEVYNNGTSLMTFSGAVVSQNNVVDFINFLNEDGVAIRYYSEICVADESTIGWDIVTFQPNASGFHTAWSGTFAEIDDSYPPSVIDLSNGAVNAEATYNSADLGTTFLKRQARTFMVQVVGAVTGSPGANMQALVRTEAQTFTSANLGITPGSGMEIKQAFFNTNPRTSEPWLSYNINELEFGMKLV